MKRTYPKILILLILLPLALAACGGGATGSAEDFLKAVDENDIGNAKDASCDDFSNEIDVLWENATNDDEVKDLDCEEDGDDVKCTFKDQEDNEVVFVFAIEDDKVCGIKSVRYDGEDAGFSLSSDTADNQ
jgi:hypothetical protein